MRSRPFYWKTTIDLTDLDYMNIVGNAAWLLVLQKARGDLLQQLEYPLPELFRDGIGGVVNEARILYVRPGKFCDAVTIETVVETFSDTCALLHHRVLNDQNRIMVKATLTIVFVDATTHKGIPIPERLKKSLERHSSS